MKYLIVYALLLAVSGQASASVGALEVRCPPFAYFCEMTTAATAPVRICYDDRFFADGRWFATSAANPVQQAHAADLFEHDPTCDLYVIAGTQSIWADSDMTDITRSYCVKRPAQEAPVGGVRLSVHPAGQGSTLVLGSGAAWLLGNSETRPWHIYAHHGEIRLYETRHWLDWVGTRLATAAPCAAQAGAACLSMPMVDAMQTEGMVDVLGALLGLHLRTLH